MDPTDANAPREPRGAAGEGDLPEIATQWELVRDPAHVVLRYAPAIRRYFGVLIRDCNDADEAAQDFFVRIMNGGFSRARQERGRFRDYLARAVRNAAFNFLRNQGVARAGRAPITDAVVAEGPEGHDKEWLLGWRRCLLRRAWRGLAKHQQRSAGNLCHTVLSAIARHPDEDCTRLAARVSHSVGRPVSPAAFRKQVSRARRTLAQILMAEVARTLDCPTREQVAEELAELGLWERVRPYLPATQRQRPKT
jgi:hypothetical protein